jgi:hypothetical protein
MWKKSKEGKVVANNVFAISCEGIFYLRQGVMALHTLHYKQ